MIDIWILIIHESDINTTILLIEWLDDSFLAGARNVAPLVPLQYIFLANSSPSPPSSSYTFCWACFQVPDPFCFYKCKKWLFNWGADFRKGYHSCHRRGVWGSLDNVLKPRRVLIDLGFWQSAWMIECHTYPWNLRWTQTALRTT